MFTRIARGWELTKQSGRVLLSDKQLLIFPILSSAACLLVMISFVAPPAAFIDWSKFGQHRPGDGGLPLDVKANPLYWLWLFGFYFVNYFVIAFFNSALVASAMSKFNGEDGSVKTGLRAAIRRLPQILGWSLVNATVGMILRTISERAGLLGRLVIGLIGMAWSIATYFVVPILVIEGIGPIAAVKRSTALIRQTWGESLTGFVTVGAMSGIVALLSFIPALAGIAISIATDTWGAAAAGGAITVILLIAASLIFSTLHVIVLAATYRYAATGLVPEAFDGELLKQAFRAKKQK